MTSDAKPSSLSAALQQRWNGARVAITGATGWLGRCLVDEVVAALGVRRVEREVLLVASRAREVTTGNGSKLLVSGWTPDVVHAFRPTHVVNLAFRTREMVMAMGVEGYVAANLRTIGAALDLMHESSVEGFLTTSSGVAGLVRQRAAVLEDPYAVLKRYEEELVRLHGTLHGKSTIVCRVWSVSGAHLTKVEDFALASFINQARAGGPVRVRSGHPVWRTYVDAGQLLGIGLCLLLDGRSADFDSGGFAVELGELASQVAEIMGPPGCLVERAPADGLPADIYLSESSALERLARELEIELLSLPDQIRRTAAGMGFQ